MKAIKTKDVKKRDAKIIPTKRAEKVKTFDRKDKTFTKGQALLKIESVDAFIRAKMPEDTKAHIIDMYEQLHTVNKKVAGKFETSIAEISLPKVKTAKVYAGRYDLDSVRGTDKEIPYIVEFIGDVFINDDNKIEYEVLSANLGNVKLTADVADKIISEMIFEPVIFHMNDRMYSILDTPELFMYIIQKERSNSSIGIVCQAEAETINVKVPVEESNLDVIQDYLVNKQTDAKTDPDANVQDDPETKTVDDVDAETEENE